MVDYTEVELDDIEDKMGDNDPNNIYAVEDVLREFMLPKANRKNTLFYWAVRAGNVDIVRGTLAMLKRKKHELEISWLLGLRTINNGYQKVDEKGDEGLVQTCFNIAGHVLLLFSLCFLLLVAFTPLFLPCHVTMATICMVATKRKKLATTNCLPLFLACQGRSKAVLMLFRNNGVMLNQHDDNGNNIFHALVDYSKEDKHRSVQAYHCLVDAYDDDMWGIQQAALKQVDKNGLTALEACFKGGAPQLIQAMLDTEGLLKHKLLSMTSTSCSMTANYRKFTGLPSEMGFTLDNDEMYNNNADDANSLDQVEPPVEKCESLDGVRGKRDLSTLGEEEDRLTRDPPSDTLSCCKLRYDATDYEYGGLFHKQSLLLTFLTKRQVDSLEEEDLTSLLANKFLNTWIHMKQNYLNWVLGCDIIYRLLWLGLSFYLCMISTHSNDPHNLSISFVNHFLEEIDYVSYYHRNATPNASSYREYCPNSKKQFLNMTIDICEVEAIENMQKECSTVDIVGLMAAVKPQRFSQLWTTEGNPLWILDVLIVCSICQLSKSILTAMMFLIQNLRHYTLFVGIRRILFTSIAGCSLNQFLLDFVAYMLIIFRLNIYSINNIEYFVPDLSNLSHVRFHIIVILLLGLCVTVLVTLQVLPIIGFFITTTITLAKCLGQFVLVYGLVFLSTSSLFLIVMRSDKCLIEPQAAFSNLYNSMYETYKLLFGVGDFHYDFDSTSKILYIIYSIYCVLLLLNLIIAMMSAMAEQLANKSLKKLMIHTFYLNELLRCEIGVNIVSSLFKRKWRLLRNSGFVVELSRRGEVNKSDLAKKGVYIDVEIY